MFNTQYGEWFDLPNWVHHSKNWWVLSDTHGEADALKHFMDIAPSDVQIIHLGDIGDRGPDSLECFRILDESNALLIAGNHDLFIKPVLQCNYNIKGVWMYNGGKKFLSEIKKLPDYVHGQVPALIQRVLERQKKYFMDGNLLFLHGGAAPQIPLLPFLELPPPAARDLKMSSPYPFHSTWLRFEFLFENSDTIWRGAERKPFFIHGHTPLGDDKNIMECTRRTDWRLGIDWQDGLSALEIRDGRARFVDMPEAEYLHR